jgi:hypothetical protein
MAGVITPSMPVLVVENIAFGNRAYTTINEGVGAVLRYGANGPDVIERLRWMTSVAGPVFANAVARTLETAPIALTELLAQALTMGDELHQRNTAASALFLRRLLPALASLERTSSGTGVNGSDVATVASFAAGNDQFFLNLSMATAKATMDPARGVAGSSVVVAMARNGTDFGIQTSGTGDRWFTAPANLPVGRYLPGFTAADANPDLGDSAITETAGLGGFALAAAPTTVQQLGVPNVAATLTYSRRMRDLTASESPVFRIPALEFAGTGVGIDVHCVVTAGEEPLITTGIAHRRAGIGQVGVGLVRAPMACFVKALAALEAPEMSIGGMVTSDLLALDGITKSLYGHSTRS